MTKKIPEKLQHAYNNQDTCYSGPSDIDIIDKINSIIDYLKDKEGFIESPTDKE